MLLLDMITRDPKDPDHPKTRRIDLKRQQTLIRDHMWHCALNGKTVTFVPVCD